MGDDVKEKPRLVVLAAGLGTRYGGLKQLDPVGPAGTTLMDYAFADAYRAGFGSAAVVVRSEIADAVESHLRRTVAGRFPVELVVQDPGDLPGGYAPPPDRTAPWGTTHAVWAARRVLDGPFVVANADDHYGPEAYVALAAHLSGVGGRGGSGSWGLAGYRLGDVLSPHGPVNRGLCRVDEDGWLEDVVEGRELERNPAGLVEGWTREQGPVRLSGDEPVSTNLWAFTREAPAFLEAGLVRFLEERGRTDPEAECLLPDVVREGLRAGRCRVRVRRVQGDFFGVTHPEDRPEVVRRLARRGPPWGSAGAPAGRTGHAEPGRTEEKAPQSSLTDAPADGSTPKSRDPRGGRSSRPE